MLEQYLEQLGFSDKDVMIYLTVAKIGIQPASVIAKNAGLSRVSTYKRLKNMAENGFIQVYSRDAIQCFGIDGVLPLKELLTEKMRGLSEVQQNFDLIENMLRALMPGQEMIPRLQIFEGEAGIKRLFRDILHEIRKQDVRQIRMLTSNTFSEQIGDTPLSHYMGEFYAEIQKRRVDLEIFEASGTLLPERISKLSLREFDPAKFPASRGVTNIFLVGHVVYLALYKHSQIGLKIEQSDISQIFHFLFDFVGKKVGE